MTKARREIINLVFCSVTLLGIIHFLTRPKIITETEYVNVKHTEYVDREVEKRVEVPVTITKYVYEYLDSDALDFDIIFEMYHKAVGPGKLFYWRGTLYTTDIKETKWYNLLKI